ncbi:MAG TPA: NAD-dependent epimerase/dehydratase family protein [Geminicoccus sp.]|jgi:nucleoside-diphosphate-sugar epimerase|uniref:NAD-dependent epimerase/dehydratase family protein n=1 Tax=Geminicoccus sp. TaxID=2024832 RepID=UPI002E333813|nr:NAD-dependent epimerase/dehydratase family protein [Geminicoccus sp.]HEX2527651.1 NAD-dependent epimerase/dehydratase family protein [Geminicoccus sp.]
MRVLVTGAGGFIGRHLVAALPGAQAVRHDQIAAVPLDGVDVVIHAGRHRPGDPRAWRLDEDVETTLLARVQGSAARYVMLSTRAVYGPTGSAPLTEQETASPVTAYGRHKLQLEDHAQALLGDRLTVLRLANVFGYEWPGRTTFVGSMLDGLATRGIIRFDMAAATRRDFIPVEAAATAIASLASRHHPGIVNVGSGCPTACGTLAQALIDGFGRGRLVIDLDEPKDEFVLDTGVLRRRTGATVTPQNILEAAGMAGRQLARALSAG